MNKKVIDIISPEKRKQQETEKKICSFNNKSLRTEIFSREGPLFPFKKRKLTFILFALIIVGIFSYLYLVLPKARIEIWPQTEQLNLQTDFTIEWAKTLEVEQTISQQFLATEKFLKEIRAEGIIRVYNNHSTTPFPLREGTRFVSADGKLFRSPTRIVVPGKHREGRNWIQGTIDVRVVADQPGEEYNIGPTAFSLPGLLGQPSFTTVYARSNQAMTGGKIEQALRVSGEDLRKAQSALEVKTKETCLTALKNKALPGFRFLEEAVEIEVLEKISNIEVGTEIKEFDLGIRVNCRALIFNTEEVKSFAENFVKQQLLDNQTIVPESLIIDKSVRRQDINKRTATFLLRMTTDVYLAIDKLYLQGELAGKLLNETETEDFLRELLREKGVNNVSVDFWPFWVGAVPENSERIKVEIKFD